MWLVMAKKYPEARTYKGPALKSTEFAWIPIVMPSNEVDLIQRLEAVAAEEGWILLEVSVYRNEETSALPASMVRSYTIIWSGYTPGYMRSGIDVAMVALLLAFSNLIMTLGYSFRHGSDEVYEHGPETRIREAGLMSRLQPLVLITLGVIFLIKLSHKGGSDGY